MERRLSAILAADMVGYSRLMEADEIGTLGRQKVHRKELIDPAIAKFRGRIVKEMGDGILVELPSVVDAVQCAVQIQRAMPEREGDIEENKRIRYRIGINLGDIVVEGEDIYGDGVNVASRLEQLAEPGGICISGTVYDQMRSNVEVGYVTLGAVSVKNIERPIRAYRVLTEPDQIGKVIVTPAWRGNRRFWSLAGLSIIIGITLAGVWWVQKPDVDPADSGRFALEIPDQPSIAVLPFDNLSGDPKQEYFADGFSEDLITNLAQSNDLFVAARNSTFTYKNKAVNIRDVAEELGVRYILEGSVRRRDDKLRITAQLIDASTGAHVWAKRYDEPLEKLFDVQDELSREIAGTLLAKINKIDLVRSKQKRPSELSAHDYVLQARARFALRSKATTMEARELAMKAVTADPGYAPAYAVLGDTYNSAYILQWEGPEALEQAYFAARKAVELDPQLSEAHELLGRVLLRRGQHDEAINSLERSIDLNPNRSDNYASLADTLTFANRPEEAVGLLRKAMRLDPFYSPRYDMYLGRAYYFAKRYDESIAELKNCAVRAPKYRPCYMYLAPAYAERGFGEEAREAVDTLLMVSPDFSIGNSVDGHLPFVPAALDFYVAGLKKAGVPD